MYTAVLPMPAALPAQKGLVRKSKSKGFTLVELLVVVLIVGLLAAIAVPVINRVRDAAVDNVKVQNADVVNGLFATLHQGGVDMTAWAAASDALTALQSPGIDIPATVVGGATINVQLIKVLNPVAYTFTPGTALVPPRFDAVLGQRNVRP